MLRLSLGNSKQIRVTGRVRCHEDKVRRVRLRWFGDIKRRDSEYSGRRIMKKKK